MKRSIAAAALVLGLAGGAQAARPEAEPDDVILLAREGLSDETIIAFLDTREIDFELNSEEIARLHEAGVSEEVIRYLITRTSGESSDSSSAYAPTYSPPPSGYSYSSYYAPGHSVLYGSGFGWSYPPWWFHHHHHHHHRHGHAFSHHFYHHYYGYPFYAYRFYGYPFYGYPIYGRFFHRHHFHGHHHSGHHWSEQRGQGFRHGVGQGTRGDVAVGQSMRFGGRAVGEGMRFGGGGRSGRAGGFPGGSRSARTGGTSNGFGGGRGGRR